jgi:hypothetical protein
MFRARIALTPAAAAYRQFDQGRGWTDWTWGEISELVDRWITRSRPSASLSVLASNLDGEQR